MKFGISDKSYALMLATFAKEKSIKSVTLFGSRVMGNYKKGSDIDLAVISNNHELDLKLATKLNQELPIPYYFDVINYNYLKNKELKKHINTYGKVIYKAK